MEMIFSPLLLLLLHTCSFVYFTRGYSEYFVKPTLPLNYSCPGKPCLTLSQYINRTDYYFNFNNNSVFQLLSGIHTISLSLLVTNSFNITFKSYTEDDMPTVIINSSYCVCPDGIGVCPSCSGFQFSNVYSAEVRGIQFVAVKYNANSSIAALSFNNCEAVTLVRVSATITDQHGISKSLRCLKRHGLKYLYILCTCVLLHESTNTSFLNSTFSYGSIHVDGSYNTVFQELLINNSIRQGISVEYSKNVTIDKVHISNSASHCIRLEETKTIYVAKISLLNCGDNSVKLITCDNTLLNSIYSNKSVMSLAINGSRNTTVNNLVGGPCEMVCINLQLSSHTQFNNTSLIGSGILAQNIQETSFINVSITMQNTGMLLLNADKTLIRNSSLNMSAGAAVSALFASNSSNTFIQNTKFGTSISIKNCQNTVLDEIHVGKNSTLILDHSNSTLIQHTNFQFFYGSKNRNTLDHDSIVLLYQSKDVRFYKCNFSNNKISAIKAIGTNLTLSGSLIFTNNTAPIGTGLVLYQQSAVIITSNSSVVFSNNNATLFGGAIYVDTNIFYVSNFESIVQNAVCMFIYEGGSIEFYNNSAKSGGDILYGGHMGLAKTTDGSNCLHQFKMVSKVSQMNTLSAISSQPLRVCVCNSSGLPDCLRVFDSYTIYPGETIYISAVVVGQDFGTGIGSVYGKFSDDFNTTLEKWQYSQMVTHTHCNQLKYSIFTSSTSNTLFLTAFELPQLQSVSNSTVQTALKDFENYQRGEGQFPQDLLSFPVQIDISIKKCPMGFALSRYPYKCLCAPQLRKLPGVKCYIETFAFERRELSWIDITNKSIRVSSDCRFNYCKHFALNISADDMNLQCNFNHSGVLCGSCKKGLSIALGSENTCIKCSNEYLSLMIPFAVAGIGLICAIKLLDVTVSTGYINGLALYFNIVHIMWLLLLPPNNNKAIAAIVAWMNLDLGIEMCFFDGLTTYWKTWLQLVFPLYLWSISIVIVILARFSRRIAGLMGTNPVSALATLFLLSYTKLLRNCVSVMFYSVVDYPHKTEIVWSIDGSIEYLGPKHLPLFLAALVFLTFFCLPYTFALLFGQCLIRCNNRAVSHAMFRIKPIMDAYYGPLKDKHRYWVGMLLLSRAVIYIVLALVPKPHIKGCLLAASILAVFLLKLSGCAMGYYRNWRVSVYEVTLISNLAIYAITKLYIEQTRYETLLLVDNLFVGAGIAQFCLLIIALSFAKIKHKIQFQTIQSCFKWFEGRANIHEQNNILENEQVPLMRDSPVTNEKKCMSINSLPTYGT